MRTGQRLRNLIAHLRQAGTDERLRSAAVKYGRLDYPGEEIHLQLTSRHEFYRLRSCAKEPWTVSWIEGYLKPGEVLYDVGANVGAYTLVAAVAVPGARIVSFEPGPGSFAALCANLGLNGVTDRVTPLPLALGDRPRSAMLGRDAAEPGGSSRLDEAPEAEEATTVLVDRLDDIVERFDLPSPNHLKLDVDGTELEVLAGAERLLASKGLRSAMVELDNERADAVIDCLTGFGLELVDRASGRDRARAMPTYGLFART